MGSFDLRFSTDNEAFADDPIEEVRRILGRVDEILEAGYWSGYVRDRNGNTIGSFTLTNGEGEEE